jgi:long-chain acyl-CoA synthetase
MTDGVANLLADLPSRISDLATRWAAIAPERPALVEASGTWRYGELPVIVAATRRWLEENGVRPGDRVMLVAENCRATVALLLAAASLNAWSVIVNPRLSDREIDQIRDHARPRRVVYTVAVSPRARAHAERHGAAAHIVNPLGSLALGPLDEAATAEPVHADGADQVAAVIYTSGTTGTPKGVMLTHRNLLFVAKVSGLLRRLGPDDRVYGVLPSSHILGLSVVLLGSLYHGAALHLTARFDPAAALAALQRDRLTFMLGAPGMYALFAEYAKAKGIERIADHSLRMISAAGAPLDPATKAAAEELFGITLHNGYGITECAPTISQTRLEQPRIDCSVGPIWPGIETKLVGAEGEPVAPGEIGQLLVRGPNLMKGYYRAPQEIAAAIDRDGWFNTRDLARFEDDHLFIVGRAKELIIRFGFNVYPPEVETVLNAHPAVTQSAVIGRPAAGTEDIIAFVQPAPGAAVSDLELAEHAARELASYKVPTEIFVMPSLPTGANGKILKAALAPLAEQLLARKRAA